MFLTFDGSSIGLGSVRFQLNEDNKLKVFSYNSRIFNPQEQKRSTLDCEILGTVHALQFRSFSLLVLHIQFTFSQIINIFYKKGNLGAQFPCAQIQSTKFSKFKIIHTPGKIFPWLTCSVFFFTKTELQDNKLKQKRLSPQSDVAILQNHTPKHVHYLFKHEVLSHQKNDSHPTFADYGRVHFCIRNDDKGYDIIVKPLDSLLNSITPLQKN